MYDYLFCQTIFALCMCVSAGRDVYLTGGGHQHVARMGERRDDYRVLVGKPRRKEATRET